MLLVFGPYLMQGVFQKQQNREIHRGLYQTRPLRAMTSALIHSVRIELTAQKETLRSRLSLYLPLNLPSSLPSSPIFQAPPLAVTMPCTKICSLRVINRSGKGCLLHN